MGVNKYVQTLGRDHREAMTLAQEHDMKQKTKQAKKYNRRCKGHSLEVGDRAKKGERGKRKLADRLESLIYYETLFFQFFYNAFTRHASL